MSRRARTAIADELVKPALVRMGCSDADAAELAPWVVAVLASPAAGGASYVYGPGIGPDGRLVARTTTIREQMLDLLFPDE